MKKKGTFQTEEKPTKQNKEKVKAEKIAGEEKEKSSVKKTKRAGRYVVLLLGLLLLILGLWLWTKTLGTQLLFTNVRIGRISRYWFIPVLVGAVFFTAAVISVVRKPKMKDESQEVQAPTVET